MLCQISEGKISNGTTATTTAAAAAATAGAIATAAAITPSAATATITAEATESKEPRQGIDVVERVTGVRRSGVKLYNSTTKAFFRRGFEGILAKNLAEIERVLENVETSALYCLRRSNCQHEVDKWQKTLVESSLSLQFHVPGSHESLPIDDDKIVEIVEQLFPHWKEGKVQRLPDLPNPFAIGTRDQVEVLEEPLRQEYDYLRMKQRVVDAVGEYLQRENKAQETRITILSNLSQLKFSQALTKTGQLSNTVVDVLSQFWSATFELIIVHEEVGVIIFKFGGGKEEGEETEDEGEEEEPATKTDESEESAELIDLAVKIEDVTKEKRRFVVVSFNLDAATKGVSKLRKCGRGYEISASVSHDILASDDSVQLVGILQTVFAKITTSAKVPFFQPTKSSTSLRKFTAKSNAL